jgi:DNA-binding transcriptional MerR regulator
MRTKQAAQFLGVSPATLKRLLRQYHDHPTVQNIRRSSGGHRIFSAELLEGLARTIDRAGQDIARRRAPQARRAWHAR